MGEEELVAGDGWVSDDSSIYGNEDVQERLTLLYEDSDLKTYWSVHEKDLNVITAKQRTMPPPGLFNPGEGRPEYWQLGESVEDFVRRIPPLTTSRMVYDWIWVENPHRHGHSKPEAVHVGQFKARGLQLLQQSLRTRNNIQTTGFGKADGMVDQLLSQEAYLLEQRISDLALDANILAGKWMLFPELEDLTRIWRLVVDGVINNRLGPTAKVAPDDGKTGARLICVYTKDYRDKGDVLRVLQELVSRGIVGNGRSIYYKCDAYTWLDIYKENAADYGLRASLYSSRSMLAEAGLAKTASTLDRKQSTLNESCTSYEPMDLS